MTNSIVKGKNFERDVANILTKITGKKFNRVPSSGAMATAQNITDNRFKGDVFSEDADFSNWVIECKITKDPITLAHLLNSKSLMWQWWRQLVGESNKTNVRVLIFKYSNGPIFVLSDSCSVLETLKCTMRTGMYNLEIGLLGDA